MQPARAYFCFSLFISLITYLSPRSGTAATKMLHNKKRRCVINYKLIYSLLTAHTYLIIPEGHTHTHTSTSCRPPSIKIKGWSFQLQRKPFRIRLPTERSAGFIDLPDNLRLNAIKPFTTRITPLPCVFYTDLSHTSWPDPPVSKLQLQTSVVTLSALS